MELESSEIHPRPLEIGKIACSVSAVKDRNDDPDPQRRRAAQRVEPAIKYLFQNIDKPVQTSTLSSLAGVSNSHFFVLFKIALGCAPNEFFIRIKMRHACSLLGNQDLTIKEIAASLGYEDPFYFSRLFKSVVGVAPRAYRNNLSNSTPTPLNLLPNSSTALPQLSSLLRLTSPDEGEPAAAARKLLCVPAERQSGSADSLESAERFVPAC